jgi:hypothetical protein
MTRVFWWSLLGIVVSMIVTFSRVRVMSVLGSGIEREHKLLLE